MCNTAVYNISLNSIFQKVVQNTFCSFWFHKENKFNSDSEKHWSQRVHSPIPPPSALENIPFINLYACFFLFLRNPRIRAWYVEELIMVLAEGTWEPSDISSIISQTLSHASLCSPLMLTDTHTVVQTYPVISSVHSHLSETASLFI